MKWKNVKMCKSRTLTKKKGIRAVACEQKVRLHSERRQVPRRNGKASKKISLGEVEGSMSERMDKKSSSGRSAETWFYFKSGQIRNGKGGWETKSPLIR